MHTKFTIESICCVFEGLRGFISQAIPWCCVYEYARTFDNFRLVGVENRNLIKRALQWPGALACHQRHICENWAYLKSRGNRN